MGVWQVDVHGEGEKNYVMSVNKTAWGLDKALTNLYKIVALWATILFSQMQQFCELKLPQNCCI
jgi:hypothetical protein